VEVAMEQKSIARAEHLANYLRGDVMVANGLTMNAEDAIELYNLFRSYDIAVWIDGGWALMHYWNGKPGITRTWTLR
jgi:hypothetical protein